MQAIAAAATPRSAPQKIQRRLSTATTTRSSVSSFSSDAAGDRWLGSSMSFDDVDNDDCCDNDTLAARVRELQHENELLRRDLVKRQDAHELALHLRKQVQMLEMEMLIRGSATHASLTGLLSSLELRESFQDVRLSMLETSSSDGDASSDGNERVSMLGGCYNDSDDDVVDLHNSSTSSIACLYDDDTSEPDVERECDVRQSFFVEKFIDPTDSTDDEVDALESESNRVGCGDCIARERELACVRADATECIEQLECDNNALQHRMSAAQQQIDELEAELAHERALASCQKELLDAFQTDFSDEDELLLRLEESGRSAVDQPHSRDWSRTELATLLVALALLCATLYGVSSR